MSAPHVIPMSDDAEAITLDDVRPTILPDAYVASQEAQSATSFHMPRYDELPQVELYREQVLTYIEGELEPLAFCVVGPWLTPSMVNNYVKQGLLDPPAKRLYNREQIARLLVICIFKQVLSIDAVARLFRIQMVTYRVPRAYDYVAVELEGALRTAFSTDPVPSDDTASLITRESLLVRNAVTAFATKANLMGYLKFLGYDQDTRR